MTSTTFGIIGGIDLYLIGIVLLLFSFGIYELFISKIDIRRQADQEIQILEIKSLEQLKDKVLKVIVMVLVVGFFKRVMKCLSLINIVQGGRFVCFFIDT